MSAELIRQAARLMRERENTPFMLAIADWLMASAGWISGPRHDAALNVANAYLGETAGRALGAWHPDHPDRVAARRERDARHLAEALTERDAEHEGGERP